MTNPFNRAWDQSVRGLEANVHTAQGRTYQGVIDRAHHGQHAMLLHGARLLEDADRDADTHQWASVWVRDAVAIEVISCHRRVEFRDVYELMANPRHPGGIDPKPQIVRAAYRDGFTGSFPVVRTDGTVINGHKRVAAARAAGLERHAVEVVDVTDEQAERLFYLAHPRRAASAFRWGEDRA